MLDMNSFFVVGRVYDFDTLLSWVWYFGIWLIATVYILGYLLFFIIEKRSGGKKKKEVEPAVKETFFAKAITLVAIVGMSSFLYYSVAVNVFNVPSRVVILDENTARIHYRFNPSKEINKGDFTTWSYRVTKEITGGGRRGGHSVIECEVYLLHKEREKSIKLVGAEYLCSWIKNALEKQSASITQ